MGLMNDLLLLKRYFFRNFPFKNEEESRTCEALLFAKKHTLKGN